MVLAYRSKTNTLQFQILVASSSSNRCKDHFYLINFTSYLSSSIRCLQFIIWIKTNLLLILIYLVNIILEFFLCPTVYLTIFLCYVLRYSSRLFGKSHLIIIVIKDAIYCSAALLTFIIALIAFLTFYFLVSKSSYSGISIFQSYYYQ